tara:strand:+ start:1747 stop:1923 length:177 start_codon:yes stop_codon:yes gene_type:complete
MQIMTQIPIGTKLQVKKTDEVVTLDEIKYYPTRFKTITESGKVEYYKTHEVTILEESN